MGVLRFTSPRKTALRDPSPEACLCFKCALLVEGRNKPIRPLALRSCIHSRNGDLLGHSDRPVKKTDRVPAGLTSDLFGHDNNANASSGRNETSPTENNKSAGHFKLARQFPEVD